MKDQGKIIAALLIGAAAGAVAGLLLAPESGEVTRNDISDYINDALGKAKEKAQTTADSLKEYGTNLAETVKSKYSDAANDLYNYRDGIIDDIKVKAGSIAGEAESHIEDAKSKVKGVSSDLNDSVQQA